MYLDKIIIINRDSRITNEAYYLKHLTRANIGGDGAMLWLYLMNYKDQEIVTINPAIVFDKGLIPLRMYQKGFNKLVKEEFILSKESGLENEYEFYARPMPELALQRLYQGK
jgi:hypothetical protein